VLRELVHGQGLDQPPPSRNVEGSTTKTHVQPAFGDRPWEERWLRTTRSCHQFQLPPSAVVEVEAAPIPDATQQPEVPGREDHGGEHRAPVETPPPATRKTFHDWDSPPSSVMSAEQVPTLSVRHVPEESSHRWGRGGTRPRLPQRPVLERRTINR